jgi:exonuclease VII small subunit
LSRFCQQSLSDAEQKIKILMSDDEGDDALEPFNADENA